MISTLNTGDYGSTTYVSANKLQALLSWRMTTEPQKDDIMANVFINFMVKYGKFSAPQAVLEGATKEAQLACYEVSPDKEEIGDFKAGFECLTKSDQIYPMWVFMNCEDDWKKKREHPHDKSISYGCKTKWTSNMSSRREVEQEVAVSEDGMEWYSKIADFIEDLHNSPYIPTLRRLYNKRAKVLGVLPVLKEAKTKKHMRRMEAREANGGKAKRVELTKLDWVDGMDKRLSDFCVDASNSNESGSSREDSDRAA